MHSSVRLQPAIGLILLSETFSFSQLFIKLFPFPGRQNNEQATDEINCIQVTCLTNCLTWTSSSSSAKWNKHEWKYIFKKRRKKKEEIYTQHIHAYKIESHGMRQFISVSLIVTEKHIKNPPCDTSMCWLYDLISAIIYVEGMCEHISISIFVSFRRR